jgi:hypothetical protein
MDSISTSRRVKENRSIVQAEYREKKVVGSW